MLIYYILLLYVWFYIIYLFKVCGLDWFEKGHELSIKKLNVALLFPNWIRVGPGSSLNQIAGKIKAKGVAVKITGLAIVESFMDFDLIIDI